MSNNLLLKRAAPAFPELGSRTTALDCLLPRPKKRSRYESDVDDVMCSFRLSSDDWLDLGSLLNDDFESQPHLPSLVAKHDCIPSDITTSLSGALAEMIRACTEEDDELQSSRTSSQSSPPPSSSSEDHSVVSIDENDTNDGGRTGIPAEKVHITATTDLVTTQGGPEATLLTLTSFPFRVFSADDNFFRLTGLTSSKVIGEPLLTLFAAKRPKLSPHTIDSPLEVFDGTLVSVSGDDGLLGRGTSKRTMKIEPMWAKSEEQQTAQVSHYKVTLQ